MSDRPPAPANAPDGNGPVEPAAGEVQQILVGVSFTDSFRAREFMTAVTRLSARKELSVDDAVMIGVQTGDDRVVIRKRVGRENGY